MNISLCMIVKNEEKTLERCLRSVDDTVDEIIIVDTGSTDKSKDIARAFTKHVFDFEWIDDFAAARNFSFSHATLEYIMWLDADDILLPQDRQKLFQLKQSLNPMIDAVSMAYNCDFDDHGNVSLEVRRIRIVKREKNFQWYGSVHEDLSINGTLFDSDIAVTHKKMRNTDNRNLKIYENLLLQGKEFTPQDTFHYARELHQQQMYDKAIAYYLKFLDYKNTSDENVIFVCDRLADCYYQLGDYDKEIAFTLKSFEYDIPRSEACCRLGYHFLQKDEFLKASYWYRQAIDAPLPSSVWTIANFPSRTWLPHMQLALCYYKLGRYDLSYQHNKIALSYCPGDKNIINNLQYLEEHMNEYSHA